jgi:uncharacterized membrane protein YjjB (DUF3815 family)
MIDFIIHFSSSFLTAMGFSILYNIPKKTIVPAGITGAIGWTSYFFLVNYLGTVDFLATVIASFFIAFASQIFARKLKTPVIIFTLPGLIPLVPGGTAYNMMRAFVEGNMILGLEHGINTFLTAGALALGLSINGVVFQLFTSRNLFKRGSNYVP